MHLLSFGNHKLKTAHLVWGAGLLLLLVVTKDLLHSSLQDYSFYLSESVLFGTFWLLFIPLLFVLHFLRGYKSLVFRTLMMSLGHAVLFSLLVYTLSSLLMNHTYGFLRILGYTLSEHGLICLLVYGSFGYVSHYKSKTGNPQSLPVKTGKIAVRHQHKTVLLNECDIIFMKAEKPYIALHTAKKCYLHGSTLKNVLDGLASENFIQVHKSCVVNMEHAVSFVSRKNGDYDITLTNGEQVRASRTYRENFKSFLK